MVSVPSRENASFFLNIVSVTITLELNVLCSNASLLRDSVAVGMSDTRIALLGCLSLSIRCFNVQYAAAIFIEKSDILLVNYIEAAQNIY